MANVSELLSRIFDYLGRPTQDQLSLGKVLPFLLDSVQFYGVDLQLSNENFLLRSHTFTPTTKEHLVTADSFSVPVSVEIRDASSTNESDWQGIMIANATDVQDTAKDGIVAVAFYGTPPSMRWSFDPAEDIQIECKLWYEPLIEEPSTLAASPQISQAFHSMVAIRTALLCSPHLKGGEETANQLTATLTTQLAQWEGKWKLWVLLDRNARPIQRRDFRGSRAVTNRNRWSIY